MFRGKEYSNRFELSRLVQDLLNFGVLGSLCLWGMGGGEWVDGGVGGGGAPYMYTCMQMYANRCMHAHTHVKKLQMAANMFNMIVVSSPSCPSSPCCPCCPHVMPVIPTASPLFSHYPQILHLTPTNPSPTQGGPRISKFNNS